jgi:hypothetical protein
MRLPSRWQIRQLESVVANHPSGFFDLAAAPRQPLATTTWPTSPRKTRVRDFRRHASGQTSSRRRCRSIITPGSRACGYKTVSGRHEWLNRDPIQERGGINLYSFVYNNSITFLDLYGLTTYVSSQPFPWTPPCQKGPFSYTIDDGHNYTEPYTLASPWPSDNDSLQRSQGNQSLIPTFGSDTTYVTIGKTTIGGATSALPGTWNNWGGIENSTTGWGPQLNFPVGTGSGQIGVGFSGGIGGTVKFPLSGKNIQH